MQQKALGRRLNGTGAEAAASESSLEGTAWLLIDCVQADQDLPGVVKAWPPPARRGGHAPDPEPLLWCDEREERCRLGHILFFSADRGQE